MKYVYMLRGGDRHYKVGISHNVIDRIKTIQTSNPTEIELVAAVPMAEALQNEQQIHKWLADFQAKGGTEWFELDAEQALDLAIKINSLGKTQLAEYLTLRNLLYREKVMERRVQKLSEKVEELFVADPSNIRMKTALSRVDEDELLEEAEKLIREMGYASTSYLQRRLRVGYARASRLIDELERSGVVGPADGARPREVLESRPIA